MRRLTFGLGLAVALSALSACQSSQEKAEAHYHDGMELLAAGDTDRALVEFRNVFKLNGQHHDARVAYARIQRERGNLREAYGQYLRLVEQYPDDLEGNIALAEMAIANGGWDDAATYARRATALAPEDIRAKAALTVIEYREAQNVHDDAKLQDVLSRAEVLLKEHPELELVRKLLTDAAMSQKDLPKALGLIDDGLKLTPDQEELSQMRLAVLYQMGKKDELVAQLKAMIARTPDNKQIRDALISWYVSQGDTEAAEAALRAEIDPAKDELDPHIRLIQFLAQTKGPEATRAEIDSLLAANPNSAHAALYRSMLANLDFDAGKQDAAIAELQEITKQYPDAPQINTIRVTLAQMLSRVGNDVAARATLEEVLLADRSDTAALKLKATWLIRDDQTADALLALRTVLEQNPRDAEAMTLMARAHERDGNTDLMSDMLAQAVDASDQAPDESLRYASLLMLQGKQAAGEGVLLNALRRAPENGSLLGALCGFYLQQKDWDRAESIIQALDASKAEVNRRLAQELKARLLMATGKSDELTQYLQQLAGAKDGTGAAMALVQDAIRRGDVDQALIRAAELDANSKDVPQIGLLHALVLSSAGKTDAAIDRLKTLTSAAPTFPQGWLGLYNMQSAGGATAEASATLAAALKALPDDRTLLWTKAGELEREGDVEGAIAIYETLYAKDSNWSVVANNLASLLANSRSDAESFDRAEVIARRLRGSDLPAFQDTYGWIAFRRGSLDEALAHLEPAAKGLPGDMSVQYHLGMLYGALDRRDEALVLLRRVVDAKPTPPAPLLAAAKAEIARIEALPAPVQN
jgi:cellulose synthase operon protein C